jgi:hypothetical protein
VWASTAPVFYIRVLFMVVAISGLYEKNKKNIIPVSVRSGFLCFHMKVCYHVRSCFLISLLNSCPTICLSAFS